MVGKYLNGYPFGRGSDYIPPGWDDWHAYLTPASGNTAYTNYTMSENGIVNTYGTVGNDYVTDVLSAKAVDFVNSTPTGQPFFLLLGHIAPHGPTTPAARHKGTYATLPVPLSPSYNEADVSDKPAWIRTQKLKNTSAVAAEYRREAETMLAVDESMRALFEALSARGELDRTVMIFMTDNGYARGQHRWTSKRCVYEECVRTPMMIRYPGATPSVDGRLVSNIDIAPTILELAGATGTLPADGLSLVPVLRETATTWRQEVLLSWRAPKDQVPAYWAIRTDAYKYVELATGERELYDLVADPNELQNIAGQSYYASVQADLAARLTVLRQ